MPARRVLSLSLLLVLLGASVPLAAGDAAGASADPVVIAILDSGIRPDHQAFAPDQIVAWYDFTNRTPRALAAWDPLVATPYDDQGHGTAVASMAAGAPLAGVTPSHAPGAKLAVAKVLTPSSGAAAGDISRAIRWAVDVAGADVISISLGAYIPRPGGPALSAGDRAMLDALAHARASGALTLIAAGNGLNNMGLPTLSWLGPLAASPDALIVGGSDNFGASYTPRGSWDPEVAAPYSVVAACRASSTCTSRTSGTSFSTPLVAGAAATLIVAARDAGLALTPDELERILKHGARDTHVPPTLEGYGYVGATEVAQAAQRIRTGTPHPTPDAATAAYVDGVGGTERRAWSNDLF